MTVFVDDRRLKRDKTAGEPVQFYVKGGRGAAPYEMVVFDVGKSQITAIFPLQRMQGPADQQRRPRLRRQRRQQSPAAYSSIVHDD